ncbi:MAG: hypothetical protein EHM87_23345, partial [Burkholderiales bacterium]
MNAPGIDPDVAVAPPQPAAPGRPVTPSPGGPSAASGASAGPASVTVAGGGLLGMVLALRLAQSGHPVTLLEAAPRAGGLAGAQSIGGLDW